ncbi:MAG: ABC transporter ATP-binding protein [Candidatus Binatia bacterium]
MALLELDDCTLSFGGLTAVQGVALALDAGELVGLIGPNGAGKTTVFNLITGVYAPDHGTIRLDGRSIAGLAPYRITRRGIARTFQGIRLFPTMTAFENVLTARGPRAGRLLPTVLGTAGAQTQRAQIDAECLGLLEMLDLQAQRDTPARALPYGSQRRLEIARALATGPRLLLLDEPAAGTNPHEKLELMARIRWLRDTLGLGILLIEHDMKMVMEICDRLTVLDHGEVIATGSPAAICRDRTVIEAYLGEEPAR